MISKILDPNQPVHYFDSPHDHLALCGSGWLQGTNDEGDVTCAQCKSLLTMRPADEPYVDLDPWTFCQHGERPENCEICEAAHR